MAFIHPCFIRKNTPELRRKLEELGYIPPSRIWYDENFAIGTIHRNNVGEYIVFKIDDDFERVIAPSYPYIDCGTNEDLFLALAALRDDSDKKQWFVHDYQYQKVWIFSEMEDYGKEWFVHKATVEELIEYFKEK